MHHQLLIARSEVEQVAERVGPDGVRPNRLPVYRRQELVPIQIRQLLRVGVVRVHPERRHRLIGKGALLGVNEKKHSIV